MLPFVLSRGALWAKGRLDARDQYRARCADR
jgi:hypothetical protein